MKFAYFTDVILPKGKSMFITIVPAWPLLIYQNITTWMRISDWYKYGLYPNKHAQCSYTWIGNYVHVKHWDIITHPCSKFNSGLVLSMLAQYLCHHIYGISKPQWVSSLWPGDAVWRHRSGSTLAQVMAWCLMAPSHYLNQCWLIIS